MRSIFFKDLRQFFTGLTGYITIIIFLLMNGIYLFVLKDSNVFDFGYASLQSFFELAPWVFLFLIPAIAMRSLADEYKSGTFEILQTKPLTHWQIVMGKYWAILVIVVVALIPTFIYVMAIQKLSVNGSIDSGGILGSYIGLLFLAAVFAAISLCCSSFTKNAVVAFLISVVACMLFYFGFNAISKLPGFENSLGYYVDVLGIQLHYKSMSRGVLELRDIAYFGSLVFISLLLTVKSVQNRK